MTRWRRTLTAGAAVTPQVPMLMAAVVTTAPASPAATSLSGSNSRWFAHSCRVGTSLIVKLP